MNARREYPVTAVAEVEQLPSVPQPMILVPKHHSRLKKIDPVEAFFELGGILQLGGICTNSQILCPS